MVTLAPAKAEADISNKASAALWELATPAKQRTAEPIPFVADLTLLYRFGLVFTLALEQSEHYSIKLARQHHQCCGLPCTSCRHPAVLTGLPYTEIPLPNRADDGTLEACLGIVDEQVRCRACDARKDLREARRPF